MDYPVEQLCELSVGQVEASLPLHRFDVLRKRARHVSSENNRVNESVSALKAGALEEFGALMNASHASLRDDFEVSCPELDFLVETAVSIPGVLGSRMTGAGFGGCTVSLVKSSGVPRFAEHLLRAYTAQAAIKAEIYAVTPADGVKRVA
jgi:galactokinase